MAHKKRKEKNGQKIHHSGSPSLKCEDEHEGEKNEECGERAGDGCWDHVVLDLFESWVGTGRAVCVCVCACVYVG